MTAEQIKKRNNDIVVYFRTNPMNESTMAMYRKMQKRYNLSQTQVYRIIKKYDNDKQCLQN